MKKRVDLAAPIADVVKAVATPPVAPRPTMKVWGGVFISTTHARRPRVLRLEPSRPRPGGETGQ